MLRIVITSLQDIENREPVSHVILHKLYANALIQVQSETYEFSCTKGKCQDLDSLMKWLCVQNFKLANEI
jgi:hypothetical protein